MTFASTLSHKERTLRALRYEPIDRLPTQINYTGDMGIKLAQHFGVRYGDVAGALDNHLIRVDIDHAKQMDETGTILYDWWGVGFANDEEGYLAKINPLAENGDLDKYPWPDPNAPGLLDSARTTLEAKGDDFFVVPNIGFALFERAYTLRGLEQFLMDMSLEPGYAEDLLDRITEIQLTLIHRYIDMGVHGGYFGDDYGAQKNLMFSPRMWRSLMKPRLARMFEPFKERDLPIIMHSDGQIQQILPDLVEIGLTVLNPVQPEVLDHDWLRKTFGERLAYYGGISTQSTLPYGSTGDVYAAVSDVVSKLAPDGTGLLIAPSHRMMTDIPMANVTALLDAFQQL